MDIIKTNGLTKSYGKARGIIDLDLNVKQGEFFGFIGPNGAGKSTTIRTLLGLIKPNAGTITIFGKDLTENQEEILKDVGYLPSETQFYPGMKVKNLLKFSASLRKKDCSQEAESLCSRLQLDPTRKVEELSLGNRKKAAIVCALQHDPSLLILDEPTSGLDPLMQKEFFHLLKERHQQGVTILLSSHVLSEVQQHCDRAAIIREGRIIACDKVEALAGTNAKRISLTGTIDLDSLPGVHSVQYSKEGVSFLYSGDAKQLLKTLLEGTVTDFTVTEPDLEETFLHFYEPEDL